MKLYRHYDKNKDQANEPLFYALVQGSANFSCKGQDSKYLRLF